MFIKTSYRFMGECFIFLLLFDLIESTNKSSNENKIKSAAELDKIKDEDFSFLKNEKFFNFLQHESVLQSSYLMNDASNSKLLSLNLIKIHPYCKILLQDFYFNKLTKLDLDRFFSSSENLSKTGNHNVTSCLDDLRKLRDFFINHKDKFSKPNVSLINAKQTGSNQTAQLNLNSKSLSLKSKRQHPTKHQTLILKDKNLDTDEHESLLLKFLNTTEKDENFISNKQPTNLLNNYQFSLELNSAKYKNDQSLNKRLFSDNKNLTTILKQIDPNPFATDNLILPKGCKLEDYNFYFCSGNLTEVPKIDATVYILTLKKIYIKIISRNSFSSYGSLKILNIYKPYRLESIEKDAFSQLTSLQSLTIKQAPLLKSIDPNVFANCPSQISLYIIQSGLEVAINITHNLNKSIVAALTFDNNKIKILKRETFKVSVKSMSFDYNLIESIEDNAFDGSYIGHLSLKGNNKLTQISENAFNNVQALNSLDLSETSIVKLPTIGLEELEVLSMARTYTLKRFPAVFKLRKIKKAILTYPYHCCAFKFPKQQDEYINFRNLYATLCNNSQSNIVKLTTSSPLNANLSEIPRLIAAPKELGDGYFIDKPVRPVVDSTMVPPFISKFCGEFVDTRDIQEDVICQPAPDAFNPCEDIMGNWILRITVWFVLIAALIGNFSVFVILFTGKLPINVSKFLMCNLACADFLMGVYLLMIAVFDLRTMGQYFNWAIDWQHGMGCKMAGFITVFSSELSIYTLTVITMERYFPIAYPLQINKRLKLGLAFKIMLGGWLYSLLMASLPLPFLGISSYSKTSICLPMETRDAYDIAYLVFILCFSAVDFVLICVCYGKMYLSIISQKTRATNNDMKVAKGMAMLVFTDFSCFMPITFFGLTALAGYPLIDVTRSKILLVFFFPLNSMCNPFLYTILTKQLRRDFYSLISRFGLCPGKALRFRPTPITAPCTHYQAYYRHYHRHRHNAKCLATISTANSGSSSNCQSMPGFSDCLNPTNTSNSYSASASQFSSSMYNNDSYLNMDPNSKNRHQSKIQRYYYRNPYPHHHFSVSKQYKEPPAVAAEMCCSKYNHKDHKKHMHCYHHHSHHHHRKHPHSAPVSQVESQSIMLESNSENLENNNSSEKQNKQNYLNTNTYLNNALSASILYNQNLSSCSSSTDYGCMAASGDHSKCTALDKNKVYGSNCVLKDKKCLIKCLTLFKQNLHNSSYKKDLQKNEIGSLTTGTTYDSTFTTTNNPTTALTQLSIESSNHVENRKLKDLNELTNGLFNNINNGAPTGKLVDLDYAASTAKANGQKEDDKKIELNDALKTISTYQTTTNNGLLIKKASFRTSQANSSKTNTNPFTNTKLIVENKSKLNFESNKQTKKEKSIKFKFKLSSNKQNKTNEIELKKLKKNAPDASKVNSSKLSNQQCLENRVAYMEINQPDQQYPVRIEGFGDRRQEQTGALKENCPKELINQQDDQTNKARERTKSTILEDLMSNQVRTKPKILKKWKNLGKQKREYNCHTNFKFNDLKNSQLRNEPQIDKLDHGNQRNKMILKSADFNRISATKEDDNQIKKKQSLLPRLIGYNNNNKDTLFNRIFRSLTSSSSSNHQLSINSNLSPNTSDNLNTSNGCLNATNSSNDKLAAATANKAQPKETRNSKKINKSFDLKEMKSSKSFSLNELKSKNSTKLNLSLSSLETSPKRITADLADTLEN